MEAREYADQSTVFEVRVQAGKDVSFVDALF